MTVRTRSWMGAVMVAAGVLGMVVAMLTARVRDRVASYPEAVLWCGLGLAIGGVAVILWALAGALRQIGDSGSRLEARLRAEADAQREQKRPS